MESDLTFELRVRVRARAQYRCEYCQTAESLSGTRGQIDHIIPRARQGQATEDNLCLACVACNGHKHARLTAIDPESGEQVSLFNPRQQLWRDHFAWQMDGTEIIGLTPTGRATVFALDMNNPLIVSARSLWRDFGFHPPQEE